MKIIKTSLTLILLITLNTSFSQDQIKTFEKGKLEIKEGIPFLTVEGSPYEAGVQYGTLLNDQLNEMHQTLDDLIDKYLGKNPFKRGIAYFVLNSKIRKWKKRMPEDYLRELEGIADASDLSKRKVMIIAFFPQLFFDISCSAFIIRDEDQLIHGRNLDWYGIGVLKDFPLIVTYKIDGKIPYTNITYMGYPGVYTGINHSGLSVSINMNSAPAEVGKDKDDYNISMPVAYKVRELLEGANNITETDKLLDGYSSHSWFLTVGSKNDNAGAIYELTRGEVIKNEMNSDFLYIENLSISKKGRYFYSPIRMHNTFNIGREKKIMQLNNRFQENDLVEKTYKIISNTEYYDYPHNPSFSGSINNSLTVISTILDNKNLDIYFTYGETCSAWGKFTKYDIDNEIIEVFKPLISNNETKQMHAYGEFHKWYMENNSKKKLSVEERNKIIDKLKSSEMDKGYKAQLLSVQYRKLSKWDEAIDQADEYILEYPEYYYVYYNKYLILSQKQDYQSALSALKNMMQTETLPVYYDYKANIEMVKTMDKILVLNPKGNEYNEEIRRCVNKAKLLANEFYVDERTKKELDEVEQIALKYNSVGNE